MIQVGMFADNMMGGAPVAVLTYSGRGKKVNIETENEELRGFLTDFITKPFGLAANSIAWPEDRQI